MTDWTRGRWRGWRASIPLAESGAASQRGGASAPDGDPGASRLVGARTALVNAARGLAKSYGERLRKCGTQQVGKNLAAALSPEMRAALEPLLAEVESLNQRIADYDRQIEQIATEVHPEVARLKQVKGVGTLIALTYVLTVEIRADFAAAATWVVTWGCVPGAGTRATVNRSCTSARKETATCEP